MTSPIPKVRVVHDRSPDHPNTPEWNVTLSANYGDHPIGPWCYSDAQLALLDVDVTITFGPTNCTARFCVRAVLVEEATSTAVARWEQVASSVGLPAWRVTRLSVDLIEASADDRRAGRNAPPQRHLAVVRNATHVDRSDVSRLVRAR